MTDPTGLEKQEREGSMSQSVRRPGEDFRYRLVQKLNAAVRALRDAEDIARVEYPEWPAADRVRSVYEQITADLLDGTVTRPPLVRRLRDSEERALRLANALDDAGVSEARIQELWGERV
jgi:hypothetical protein